METDEDLLALLDQPPPKFTVTEEKVCCVCRHCVVKFLSSSCWEDRLRLIITFCVCCKQIRPTKVIRRFQFDDLKILHSPYPTYY